MKLGMFIIKVPLFIFTSLIPCLIPPTDDRENTERRAHQLPVTKPKKVVCLPEKVDSVSEIVDLSVSKQKSQQNTIFLAQLKKKYYLCTVNLRRGMSAHHRRRVADLLKRRLLTLCSGELKLRNFQIVFRT